MGRRRFLGRENGGCPIEALDYIAEVELYTSLTSTEKLAICQLVKDFQGIGSTPSNSNIWSKFYEFYPVITDDAAAQSIDLIQLNNWNIAGGVAAHSVNGIYVPSPLLNSCELYSNTLSLKGIDVWIYDNYPVVNNNDLHESVFSRNYGSQNAFFLRPKSADGNTRWITAGARQGHHTFTEPANVIGLWTIQDDSLGSSYVVQNNIVLDSFASSIISTPSPFRLFGYNPSGIISVQATLSMWGLRSAYFNSTEMADYTYAIDKFQTVFNRNLL